MRLIMPAVARSRRLGVGPRAVTVAGLPYWGSFESNAAFTNAGLPTVAARTLDTEASAAWANIWTNNIYGQSSTLDQLSQSTSAYAVSRNQIPSGYATAVAAWYTGNPAYYANASTIVTNMMAAMTFDDPWGGKMYDPALITTGAQTLEQMKLEDPLAFGLFSVYVRLLHENGGAPANSVTRLQQFWRRWGAGAWNWASVPGTYDASATDNHANPSTTLKMFMHPMTGLCVAGWNLYKITGDTNYRDGVHAMLEYLGYGIGTVSGSSPARASWAQLPNNPNFPNSPQARTYIRYTGAHVAFLDLDGALSGTFWNANHVREGVAHYMYRDAATAGGVRACIAGGCDTCPTTAVVVTPYKSGGVTASGGTISLNPRVLPRTPLDTWGYLDWAAARASSVLRAQYASDQAAGGTRYTRHPGSAVGLLTHEMALLT